MQKSLREKMIAEAKVKREQEKERAQNDEKA